MASFDDSGIGIAVTVCMGTCHQFPLKYIGKKREALHPLTYSGALIAPLCKGQR